MSNESIKNNKNFGQLILVINVTVFGFILMLDILLNDSRPKYVMFIQGAIMVSMWAVYWLRLFSDKGRMLYFLLVISAVVVYAGLDFKVFMDMPAALCMILICLAFAKSEKGGHFILAAYILDALYHIFYTNAFSQIPVGDQICKMALGVVSIICSCVISKYIYGYRKSHEQELEKLTDGYKGATSENKRILSRLSHELRTPVNVIKGVSEVLIKGEADEVTRSKLLSINRAGSRMGSQIDDILDYTEIIDNSLSVTVGDYAVMSTINDCVADAVAFGHTIRAEVVVNVDTDIPNILSGDEPKIKRAIRGLLDNAIRYTKSGGVFLNVSKRDTGYGINLLIEVSDTGMGMSEKEVGDIYELIKNYERAKTHNSHGLGFGLVVVHGLVSAMNGFMSIKSEKGVGTSVMLCIPQKVRDYRPAVVLANAKNYSVSCYLNREKYEDSRVAEYYNHVFENLRDKLDLDVFMAESFDELKHHVERHMATHVFISMWEYVMDKQYYIRLSKSCDVCVFVQDEDVSEVAPTINIMRAPVFILSILNALAARDIGVGGLVENESMPDYDGNIRALVIDDEKMNLIVAREILSNYGIEIVGVTSGAEAIDKCNLSNFDIIFIDHMMPEMDGIEVMENIRKLRNGSFAHTPMVALTATAVSGAREMFIKKGFDDFVPKPIEIRLMTKVLRRLLSRGRN